MDKIDTSIKDQMLPNPRVLKSFIDKEMNNRLSEYGITSSQGLFLIEIGRMEGISLKELSKHAMVDKALTTRTIKQLMELNLVSNVGNGEKYSIVLTEMGKKVRSATLANLDEIHKLMLSDLTEEELATFIGCMSKIRQTIIKLYGAED